MARVLDVLRTSPATHAGQCVLIGGTAATLIMEDAGLDCCWLRDTD